MLDPLDRRVHRDNRGHRDPREHKVLRVLLAHKVLSVLLVLKGTWVRRATSVSSASPDRRAMRVLRDLLVPKDPKGVLVLPDPRVLQGHRVTPVRLAPRATWDHRAFKEAKATLEFRETRAHRATWAQRETRARKATRVHRETSGHREIRALRGLLERRVTWVRRVLRD